MNLNEPYCFLLTIKAAVVLQSCQLFTQRHFWRRLPALHGTGQNLQLFPRHHLLSIKNSDGDAEFVTNGEYTAFIPMDDSFAQSSFGQCISYMSKVKKTWALNYDFRQSLFINIIAYTHWYGPAIKLVRVNTTSSGTN